MKIVQLSADNFKRLKAVEINPKGNVVPITGRNANGKTSVLDAIWAALGGASHIQAEPIRKGATKARIKLSLGDITVTRSFTKGGTSLVVEDAEGGAYKSPQKMLDDLVGALSFDPLEFTRMKARDQYDTLKKLAHVDLDLDKLDAQNRADYQRRTDINRDAKTLRAQAEGVVVPDAPDTLPDTEAQVEALNALRQSIQDAEDANHNRSTLERTIEEKRALFQAKREELVALKDSITALEETLISLAEPVDVTPMVTRGHELQAEIQSAAKVAGQVAERKAALQRRQDLNAQAEAKEQESAKLTEAMEAREQAKREAIAKADMPIPGLGFGDGVVLYNGVPFDQASSAERLRVSTSIAMAANPKLRVIRIEDGSLLDEENMAMLSQMAEAHDFQVWIEVVDSTGKVGVYIEDGEVKADNQEATTGLEQKSAQEIVEHAAALGIATQAIQDAVDVPDARVGIMQTEALPWDPSTPTAPNPDDKLDRAHARGEDLDIP